MMIRSAKFIKGIRGTDPICEEEVPQIAFVGRSNAGKSSVINSLVRSTDLVKVGKKPGKTKEINFFLVNHKTYFVDLPGYGYARGSLDEREQIRRMILWYLTDSGAKPVVVALIMDSNVGLTDLDRQMLDVLKANNIRCVVVANKTDKLKNTEREKIIEEIQHDAGNIEVFGYSTRSTKGTDQLLGTLFSTIRL